MNDVAVLIPHYNNFEGLKKSLKSIGQEERVDIIIVDDGSRSQIIKKKDLDSFFKKDRFISILYLRENRGIEHALNKGLEFILKKGYKYTARLDCGDTCFKTRFRIQKKFLDENPQIGIVGSLVYFHSKDNEKHYTLNLPTTDKIIRKKMYLNNMFIHPAIMFRNNILSKTGLYPTNYEAAEDYAFFFNILKYSEGANIDKVLVNCLIDFEGISSTKRKKQVSNRIKIIIKNFYFGSYPIYGFFRNCLLYLIPVKTLYYLKTKF